MQVCIEGVCVLPNQQGRGSIRVVATDFSEAWTDGREEASRAELEGSIDGDVCTCNWSNLVGYGCRRLRCKTSGVVWQR